MQRALFLFALIFLIALPPAEASTSLHDAFYAYAKVRRLEREKDLLPYSETDESARAEAAQKLGAELSQAKIDFYGIALADEKLLTAWEKQLLDRVTKKGKASDKVVDQQGLEFLTVTFPQAKNFTLVEWEMVREWFGRKTEEAFLKTAFDIRELPVHFAKASGEVVLWVRTLSPENSIGHKNGLHKDFKTLKNKLAAEGYSLEALDISPFAHADDQATELVQAISLRKTAPAILLSEAKAGAVIYRALDIYPGLRQNEAIKGWVNLNGNLYGEPPATSAARGPASVTSDPVASSAAEAKVESYRLYSENLGPTPPLVKGFPILNLLSAQGKNRQGGSLREGVVKEGSTWIAPAGKPEQALPAAFSLIGDAAI